MNPMTRYEPLVGRLDGLFNELFRPAFVWENGAASEAQPIRVDVKETAEAYTVAAEIPGVSKDRIAVEIEGNEVTISARPRERRRRKARSSCASSASTARPRAASR
jgi:HSP20 family protein